MTTISVDFLQQITLLDPTNRKQVLGELKKVLAKQMLLGDYKKIWKSLFYAMWSSDKYQNQQILSQDISQLTRCFYAKFDWYLQFARAMFYVFMAEWEKIDYWRINKFMLLFREIIEEQIKICKHFSWTVLPQIKQLYTETILNISEHQSVQGVVLHFVQIFVQCIIKHMNDEQSTHKNITDILQPFLDVVSKSNNKNIREKIYQYVFEYLKDKHENENQLQQFSLLKYGTKIFKNAKSVDLIPVNRKSLYRIAELFGFQDEENEDENDEQNNESEIVKKKKKNKKNKKVKQQEEQIEQQEQEQVEQQEEQLDEQQELELEEEEEEQQIQKISKKKNKNIKSTEIQSKSNQIESKIISKLKKSTQNQENVQEQIEENIEGMDYSELKQNPQRMSLLKEILNSVPPYLFMSPAEKRKYFKQINSRFQEVLQKEKGTRCTHQKQVKFNLQQNQVKTFKQTDNVLRISQ